MEEDAKIAAQKSGRLSFYVVNAIADGCTVQTQGRFFRGFKSLPKSSETFGNLHFPRVSEDCFYLLILLHVSFNDTVRLNTKCSGVESLSTLK